MTFRKMLSAAGAALALSLPDAAFAQEAPTVACTEPASDSPTGFRMVVRSVGPDGRDPCRPLQRRSQAWQEGDPIPYGFHVEQRPLRGLAIAGGVTLGVGYLLGLVVGSLLNREGFYAAIPIAGPFVAAATHTPPEVKCSGFGCIGASLGSSLGEVYGKTFLVVSGIAQVAGVAMLAGGLAARKSALVPDRAPAIWPVPMMAPHGGGISVIGAF